MNEIEDIIVKGMDKLDEEMKARAQAEQWTSVSKNNGFKGLKST